MQSIKELRNICQCSEKAPSWRTQSLEGRFNRIFSIYLTWLFAHTSLPVTAINIAGMLLYIGGAFLFILDDFKTNILGLVFIFLSFIFDATDGELARYRQLSKKQMEFGGSFVEPVSHDIMYSLFFLPIGIGQFITKDNIYPLIAAFIATISKLLFRLVELRYDVFARLMGELSGEKLERQNKNTPTSLSYLIYRNFFTGTGVFFILIFVVFLRRVDYFLYFYAASFSLLWIYKMYRQWRKIKLIL